MSTNAPATSPTKRRRGAVAREEALEAARNLLLSGGPAAVTLKAVGERMGVGHANLIHHFGSAAGLQGALMDRMVRDLAERIEAGLGEGRENIEPGRLMTAVFDAFGKGGASQLAAWLALAREQGRAESFAEVVRDLAERIEAGLGQGRESLEPGRLMTAVFDAFGKGGASQLAAWLALDREQGRAESFAEVMRDLADRLAAMAPNDPNAAERARALVTTAAYMAFADGLIGETLMPMLGAKDGLGLELALKLTATIMGETPDT